MESTAKPGLDITAVISSPIPAGLTKIGAGTVRFSGANTYTGLTLIALGTIELGHPSALGPGAATSIKTGGRLHLDADGSTEPLFTEGTPGTYGPTIAAAGPGPRIFNGQHRVQRSADGVRLSGASLQSGRRDLRVAAI